MNMSVHLIRIPKDTMRTVDKTRPEYQAMLDRIKAGQDEPPIVLDGRRLVDGLHRLSAYKEAGRPSIPFRNL